MIFVIRYSDPFGLPNVMDMHCRFVDLSGRAIINRQSNEMPCVDAHRKYPIVSASNHVRLCIQMACHRRPCHLIVDSGGVTYVNGFGELCTNEIINNYRHSAMRVSSEN